MDHPASTRCEAPARGSRIARLACLGLLWCMAAGAHAASVYRCTGAHGETVFGDIPCAASTPQVKLEVTGQPLIDPDAPRPSPSTQGPRAASHPRTRHASRRTRRRNPPMSWECQAADGEVFYRHSRCPGSVPGDGVVRIDWTGKRKRQRRNAWARIKVHGMKVPRAEACRRIHGAGAAGRDGHQRDATVSTYDHLMGRDPCDQT